MKDPDGGIVYHHRTVDTLGKMLRSGTISQEDVRRRQKIWRRPSSSLSSNRCGRAMLMRWWSRAGSMKRTAVEVYRWVERALQARSKRDWSIEARYLRSGRRITEQGVEPKPTADAFRGSIAWLAHHGFVT